MILYAFILYADAMDYIPYLNYWDEAITFLVIAIYALCRICNGRINCIKKSKAQQYGLLLLVISIGLLGNFFHPGIQSVNSAIFRDVVSFIKFPVLMIMLNDISLKWSLVKRKLILKRVNYISKITIILAGFIAVIQYATGIGLDYEGARLIPVYKYIYSHATYLVANIVFCVSLLMVESRKDNKFYIYVGCVILFLTQRYKAYAIIVVIVLLMKLKESQIRRMLSFEKTTKLKKKKVLPIIIVLGVALYVIFIDRFRIYLSWGMTSARLALYVVCIKIAIDFFPLGSGFGTFGSFLSGKYYSNIYTMYGLSHVQGLRIDQYNYISDTFWPWVIGQYGFIGGILYIYLIIGFIKRQFMQIKSYDKIVGFFVLWMYVLLASMMEAFFTNATGVALALILSLLIGTDTDNKNQNRDFHRSVNTYKYF